MTRPAPPARATGAPDPGGAPGQRSQGTPGRDAGAPPPNTSPRRAHSSHTAETMPGSGGPANRRCRIAAPVPSRDHRHHPGSTTGQAESRLKRRLGAQGRSGTTAMHSAHIDHSGAKLGRVSTNLRTSSWSMLIRQFYRPLSNMVRPADMRLAVELRHPFARRPRARPRPERKAMTRSLFTDQNVAVQGRLLRCRDRGAGIGHTQDEPRRNRERHPVSHGMGPRHSVQARCPPVIARPGRKGH